MSKIGVFIVDDHQLVREGLVSIIHEFNTDFQLVGTAGDGVQAINEIRSLEKRPDVVLMDINMPKMNGVECTKVMTSDFPQSKVIALTMFNQAVHIKEMLRHGVAGYVLKDCDKHELKEAILTVSKGENYFSKSVTNTVMMQYTQLKKDEKKELVQLSPREKEVLRHILKDMSNQQIAEKLHISVRTVETHKQNLISKTGTNSVAGLVVYALKNHINLELEDGD